MRKRLMKKRLKENGTVYVGLRLSGEERDRIAAEGERHQRSLSAEIRYRLAQTFGSKEASDGGNA